MDQHKNLTRYAGIAVYVANSTEKVTSLPANPALLVVVNKAQTTIKVHTFQGSQLKLVEEMNNVAMNLLNGLEGNRALKAYLLRWQHAIS